MSDIPSFRSEPIPKTIDPLTVAVLEKMFDEIQSALTKLKSVADDHETRITTLEP